MTDLRAAILDALDEIEPASIGTIDSHLQQTRENYDEPPSPDVREAIGELKEMEWVKREGDGWPPKYVRTDQ